MNSNELTKLGLTEGEAKVYLALLKLGSSTVGPIVKESKIAYSNIYEVLERLIHKGLVSFVKKEKTKHFQANAPDRLKDYLDKKEEEILHQKTKLSKLLPSLLSINKGKEKKLEAEIFSGFKGIKTAFAKLVEDYDKGEYIFFYTNYEEDYERVDDFFVSLIPLLVKPKIKFRAVADKAYKNSNLLKKTKVIKTKFIDFPIPGNIDICNNKVLITTWGDTPSSILIHSEEVAQNLTKYFEFIWNSK